MILGLASGILALGYGWWGKLEGFLRLSDPEAILTSTLIAVIHVVALASLVGGALSLLNRGIGRTILLSCAVAWLVLAAVVGGGLTAPLIITTLLAAFGGFSGFIPGGPEVHLSGDWTGEGQGADDTEAAYPIPPLRASTRPADSEPAVQEEFPPFGAEVSEEPTKSGAPVLSSAGFAAHSRTPRQGKKRQKRSSELGIGVAATVFLLGTAVILGYFVWVGDETAASISPGPTTTSSASEVETSENVALASETPPPSPPSRIPAGIDEPVSRVLAPAASEISIPRTQVSVAASEPATATNGKFTSPASYCAAVGDVDDPDLSGIEGGVTELVASVVEAGLSVQGQVRWRCMDAAVWICVQPSSSRACDKVPSALDRVTICASHPDAVAIQTAGGTWRCDGFTPVVSAAQLAPPDKRGFDRTAWRPYDPT